MCHNPGREGLPMLFTSGRWILKQSKVSDSIQNILNQFVTSKLHRGRAAACSRRVQVLSLLFRFVSSSSQVPRLGWGTWLVLLRVLVHVAVLNLYSTSTKVLSVKLFCAFQIDLQFYSHTSFTLLTNTNQNKSKLQTWNYLLSSCCFSQVDDATGGRAKQVGFKTYYLHSQYQYWYWCF